MPRAEGEQERLPDHKGGTEAPWYRGRVISEEKREFFRERALRSREAKLAAESNLADASTDPINAPALDPQTLMPQLDRSSLVSLSLFSGGGGLDLGFDRAGFTHAASYDTLDAAGETLGLNRPNWRVFAGAAGDVRDVNWRTLHKGVDVIHGGPPCQPFSVAGRQGGQTDERNMLPEFVRAVLEAKPKVFVMENVPAIAAAKFADYMQQAFYARLTNYRVTTFKLAAQDFGVPQTRKRCFFVGFRDASAASRFRPPEPTHRFQPSDQRSLLGDGEKRCMGTREALGLPTIGFDALAPTLRSTLTGPRHTTSILNSAASQKTWASLRIWPNGVAPTREAARAFPVENGHFRLAVADCAVLQGFPSDWQFHGAVYMALGQLGNSVAPPVAYRVAAAVRSALS